ncbi:MAG: Hsp20/alpha crystallin family protein [Deltaproteobacteria bacterium]|nr:Hsp20/alpha crystallin family protein [Deltaproteobacteria bacterium]
MFTHDCGRSGRSFDPWRELNRVQEDLNRFFAGAKGDYPPVNVYSNEQGLVLTADLPGVDGKELDVTVLAESVTLKGKVGEPAVEGASCSRRERFTGDFNRTLELPLRVDPEHAVADFKNGVLSLTLPRAEGAKARKINVQP